MKYLEIKSIETYHYLESQTDLTVIKGGHVTIKGKIGTNSILNLHGGMFIKEKNGDIEAGTLLILTNDACATLESSITDYVVISHQGTGTLSISGNVSEKAKIHFTGSGILKFEKRPPEGVIGICLGKGQIIYNNQQSTAFTAKNDHTNLNNTLTFNFLTKELDSIPEKSILNAECSHITICGTVGPNAQLTFSNCIFILDKNAIIYPNTTLTFINNTSAELHSYVDANVVINHHSIGNIKILGSLDEDVKINHEGSGHLYFEQNPPQKVRDSIKKNSQGIIHYKNDYDNETTLNNNSHHTQTPSDQNKSTATSTTSFAHDIKIPDELLASQIKALKEAEQRMAERRQKKNDDVISNDNSDSNPQHPVGVKSSYAYVGANLSHSIERIDIFGNSGNEQAVKVNKRENTAYSYQGNQLPHVKERMFAEGKPISKSHNNVSDNNSEVKIREAAQIDEEIFKKLRVRTQNYIMKIIKENIPGSLKYADLSAAEEALLSEFINIIDKNHPIMSVPVILNESRYEFKTLIDFYQRTGNEPNTNDPFELSDIQSDYKGADRLRTIIADIIKARKSAEETPQASGMKP